MESEERGREGEMVRDEDGEREREREGEGEGDCSQWPKIVQWD